MSAKRVDEYCIEVVGNKLSEAAINALQPISDKYIGLLDLESVCSEANEIKAELESIGEVAKFQVRKIESEGDTNIIESEGD